MRRIDPTCNYLKVGENLMCNEVICLATPGISLLILECERKRNRITVTSKKIIRKTEVYYFPMETACSPWQSSEEIGYSIYRMQNRDMSALCV